MSVEDRKNNIVQFTQAEAEQNNKLAVQIKQQFMRNHIEITAKGTTDITNMIRDEKALYANLGIDFAVNFVAAVEKKKKI